MNLDDIQATESPKCHADEQSVDSLEQELGVRPPSGYREFISRYGEGELAGLVRVYPPHQVLEGDNGVDSWRERIDEYWFWEAGEAVLPKPRALECVIIADTVDGDEVVFHPSEPDALFVLPYGDEEVYRIDGGLVPALEWLLTSGELTDPIPKEEFTFEPFDSKAAAASVTDEDDDSIEPVPGLLGMETSQETTHDGQQRIECRVFRFGADHYTGDWKEGSPPLVEETVLRENATNAATEEFGEPARVEDIELDRSTPPGFYRVECVPVADKGFGFFEKTIYLDLKGRVVRAETFKFTSAEQYQAFESELYGR